MDSKPQFDTIQAVTECYEPTAAFQKELCEYWYNRVNEVPQLKALRDFVEENVRGWDSVEEDFTRTGLFKKRTRPRFLVSLFFKTPALGRD